jgi:hypothetical protein
MLPMRMFHAFGDTAHLNDCDYLLFLDADAHFYSHEMRIQDELIPLMDGKEILMAHYAVKCFLMRNWS